MVFLFLFLRQNGPESVAAAYFKSRLNTGSHCQKNLTWHSAQWSFSWVSWSRSYRSSEILHQKKKTFQAQNIKKLRTSTFVSPSVGKLDALIKKKSVCININASVLNIWRQHSLPCSKLSCNNEFDNWTFDCVQLPIIFFSWARFALDYRTQCDWNSVRVPDNQMLVSGHWPFREGDSLHGRRNWWRGGEAREVGKNEESAKPCWTYTDTLVYPFLMYCIIAWHNTYQTTLQHLLAKKKSIRIITFSSFF